MRPHRGGLEGEAGDVRIPRMPNARIGTGVYFCRQRRLIEVFEQGHDRMGAVLSEYQVSSQESGLDSREMGSR